MDVAGSANGRIRIVTGPRGAGKSGYCQRMAADARQRGWRVAGVLSLAKFEDEQKAGIEVEDLASGERRPLASKRSLFPQGPHLGCWNFDAGAIGWANAILQRATPCDLLVVDELGPLEFDREQGFMAAFEALMEGDFRLALVVVRPEYLEQAKGLWPDSDVEILSTRANG